MEPTRLSLSGECLGGGHLPQWQPPFGLVLPGLPVDILKQFSPLDLARHNRRGTAHRIERVPAKANISDPDPIFETPPEGPNWWHFIFSQPSQHDASRSSGTSNLHLDWVLRVYPRSGCCIRICNDLSIQIRSGFDACCALHLLVHVLRRESNTRDGKCSIPPGFHNVYPDSSWVRIFSISGLCDPAYTVHRAFMTLRPPGELLPLLRNVGSKKSCLLAVQRV